jgi:tRNA threonylcarbamoyladenosine biosynthesis protein TsaE
MVRLRTERYGEITTKLEERSRTMRPAENGHGVNSIATTEAETVAAGRELGRSLAPGTTVLLYGELGAGKTVFVRGLVEGLGLDPDQVSSPTFTIVQEYRGAGLTLQHVDLYRLNPAEVADLALEDLQDENTVIAIEWAERLPRPPAPPIVTVHLEHASDGRKITVSQPT